MAEYPFLTIDVDGSIRASGKTAVRRLAGSTGRWRLLPSSPDLIILARDRDTAKGPDGRPAAQPRIPLIGDIEALGGLTDLIGFVHQNQWSCVLHTVDEKAHRSVWFKHGDVRTCGSNLPTDRLGDLLYRYGRVSRQDLDAALARVGPEQRIGQALVEMGAVSMHDLFTFVRKQVEEVFHAVLHLKRGHFYFEKSTGEEKLPDLGLSTQNLLLEGVRRMDEMHYFREKIPTSDVVPVRRAGAPKAPPEKGHGAVVLGLVNGQRTVEEIARASKLGEFEATRTLFQLIQGGYIEIWHELDVSDLGGLSRSQPPGTGLGTGEGGLTRLIEVFNELLARVHATLAASNKAQRFRANLAAFFRGETAYVELFNEIEPLPDGRLPADRLLANLARVQVEDEVQYLHQGLNELLFFLVFTVGEVIGRQGEQELTRRLNEIMRELGGQR